MTRVGIEPLRPGENLISTLVLKWMGSIPANVGHTDKTIPFLSFF